MIQPFRPEILHTVFKMNDEVTKTLYESIYSELIKHGELKPWASLGYQAPETTDGYCVRLLQNAVNKLRLSFLITPL